MSHYFNPSSVAKKFTEITKTHIFSSNRISNFLVFLSTVSVKDSKTPPLATYAIQKNENENSVHDD